MNISANNKILKLQIQFFLVFPTRIFQFNHECFVRFRNVTQPAKSTAQAVGESLQPQAAISKSLNDGDNYFYFMLYYISKVFTVLIITPFVFYPCI